VGPRLAVVEVFAEGLVVEAAEERVRQLRVWGHSLPGGLASHSYDRTDRLGLTHARSCRNTCRVAQLCCYPPLCPLDSVFPGFSLSNACIIRYSAVACSPRTSSIRLRPTPIGTGPAVWCGAFDGYYKEARKVR